MTGSDCPQKYGPAVAVLAVGGTVKEAAKAAGVSAATLTRWRRDPTFCEALAEASEDVSSRTADALRAAADALALQACASVATLAELRDGAESPQVRRGAARDILTLCLTLRGHVELEDRVAALEDAL